MEALGGADGGQVAVALIGEHQVLGQHPLDAGGDGRAPPVGRLDDVDLEVVVEEHAASGGRDADGLVGQAHLLDDFHEQPVDDAVAAPRAVVEVRFLEQLGPLVDGLGGGRAAGRSLGHGYLPPRADCA